MTTLNEPRYIAGIMNLGGAVVAGVAFYALYAAKKNEATALVKADSRRRSSIEAPPAEAALQPPSDE